MSHGPVCRCGSTDLRPCDDLLVPSCRDEAFRATHECARCHERFRYTPPPRFTTAPAPRAEGEPT